MVFRPVVENTFIFSVEKIDATYILQQIALGIFSEANFNQFFNQYVMNLIQQHPDFKDNQVKAAREAQERIGYQATLYTDDVAIKAERLFGSYHPVLGTLSDQKSTSPTELMKTGILMGRLSSKNINFKDTLLYFPNRRYKYTLSLVLKDLALDPALQAAWELTQQEQQEVDSKTSAFFNNFDYGNSRHLSD